MLARFASALTRASAPTETDTDLLTSFVRNRDEAAFAALVERHGPMVMGTCRRILYDSHAAEDAFQAAFLVLARRAASLPRTEALARWMYGVARRVALKTRSARPESLPPQETEGRSSDPLDELSGRELLAVLDEEVRRLPSDYRLPVVLCCLEGLTLEEAAARLGCATGALRGRLERGRTRLRARLSARGLAPAAVLALAGVSRITMASTVTPGLRALTARAALNFASRTGPVPDGPRRIAESTLGAVFAAKFKRAAVVLIAVVLAVPVFAGPRTVDAPAPEEHAAVKVTPGEEPKEQPARTTVTGRVLSAPGGKGVAGVVVTLWNGEGWGASPSRWTARTDEEGAYSFANVLPGEHHRVWIEECPRKGTGAGFKNKAIGLGSTDADPRRDERPGEPNAYEKWIEVRSHKDVGTWSEWARVQFKDRAGRAEDLFIELPQSVSGTVIDADTGKPVPGASLNFPTADGNRDGLITDADGRYRLFVAPRKIDIYCNGTAVRYNKADQPQTVDVSADKHVAGIDFKIASAPKFTGQVLLPDGKLAKGVEVVVEVRCTPLNVPPGGGVYDGFDRSIHLTSDAEGNFTGHMVGARPNSNVRVVGLLAIARRPDRTFSGVASVRTSPQDGYRVDPLKIVLAEPASARVRVLNPDGEPITNANMVLSHHPPRDADQTNIVYASGSSDQHGPVKHTGAGKYTIAGLVPGLTYSLEVRAPGYQLGNHSKTFVLKSGEIHEIGEIRLDWWGKKAVPGLLKKLQGDRYNREEAARQFGELGADAAEAVPALIEVLKRDPINSVRYEAAAALGKIGPGALAAVPDLIQSLQEDAGGGVQREAATALGLLGDRSALPALKVALDHQDNEVKRAATEAIKRLERPKK
ncbi:sigma-70 family rna polymerase sigma factor : Uncultured bacterium genome assembly Metasoil_fosmids_resub OS=uncultured bacterium PE=4 SV=1: Sigma70_r2: Sigma70_r4_2: CarboxypepD_reg: HEAT_PBS: HEAT_2 [Gemmata massiliana]|uniref:RNA polymerase sigma-70 region 2 domain-containing protein n=1 Tax=Gemmata massiliana TaxID=1210884 RepID=A0A6P2D7E4_9BACT|nr:sigma-70 family RNA polymerase sigma factor [Gemmata massiliana]VTR96857.1 sigma-70 family rna polymerase sigma factor : Uncultured bacterium genome assembly Metasoil_fosmids_resub OS=uncultured bacterium PE=4 SV=1: Sigma70_r2: Sigma70_r4_2: CarboxypepD_reg: HEAT_PBS: HEAT_2 [Gemmata massiliana]